MRVSLIAEQLRGSVPGGIGTYVRGLAHGLSRLHEDGLDVDLVASGRRGLADLPLRVKVVPLPSVLLTRAWDMGVLTVSADIVHAPSLMVPWRGRGARVVMVHDLAWRVVPETFPERGRTWHESAFRRALGCASALVAPSDTTAASLEEAGAGPNRVTVIEPGCDHLPAPDELAATSLLAGLGVPGAFLLAVGTREPRKNLSRLLAAYSAARCEFPEPWPLVVVGPAGWGPELDTVPGVVLGGEVAPAVLAALYSQTRCLAYVPLMEGFGLPAVEAMRAGAPVVASPMPSTGGAALDVDPRDVDSIAEGLVVAATDDARRRSLVSAGRDRAAGLTWDRSAALHLRLWNGLM